MNLPIPQLEAQTQLSFIAPIVEEHRRGDREAHSLSGIVVELDLLRQGLEAVAGKVRRHEEELRALRGQIVQKK